MYNTSVCYRSILNMIKRSLSSSFLISLFIYVVIYLFIYLLFFGGGGGGEVAGVGGTGIFFIFFKKYPFINMGEAPPVCREHVHTGRPHTRKNPI